MLKVKATVQFAIDNIWKCNVIWLDPIVYISEMN